MAMATSTATDLLRHFLATLAYRLRTAAKDAPAGFGDFDAGYGVRTPAEVVRHMTHVISWAHVHLSDSADADPPAELPFDDELTRFHGVLAALDRDLIAHVEQTDEGVLMKLLQGPLSDAMTHAGQVAMLRRMAGLPVRGQNFAAADIRPGHVGADQSEPRRPFKK